LTPTITWPTPINVNVGTALSSTQLNATATALQINGMANAQQTTACGATTAFANCTGLLESFPVAGTYTYNPPLGTVMNTPGVYNLSVTFTPTKIATDTGTTSSTVTNSSVYETYTIATATVPISVVAPPAISLSTTSSVSGSAGGGYTVTITVTNNGAGTVNGITLNSATLGSASGTPVPQLLGGTGTLAPGASNSFTVSVPGSAGANGAGVAEKYSGTATGGSFSGSIRSVTLP
jgi:hypothetical protein